MATVINNPGSPQATDNSGAGTLLFAVVLILLVLGLLYWGVPSFSRSINNATGQNTPDQVNVDVNQTQPTDNGTQASQAPVIQLPDDIDINVQAPTNTSNPTSNPTSNTTTVPTATASPAL
jgi:hypothetical protein